MIFWAVRCEVSDLEFLPEIGPASSSPWLVMIMVLTGGGWELSQIELGLSMNVGSVLIFILTISFFVSLKLFLG